MDHSDLEELKKSFSLFKENQEVTNSKILKFLAQITKLQSRRLSYLQTVLKYDLREYQTKLNLLTNEVMPEAQVQAKCKCGRVMKLGNDQVPLITTYENLGSGRTSKRVQKSVDIQCDLDVRILEDERTYELIEKNDFQVQCELTKLRERKSKRILENNQYSYKSVYPIIEELPDYGSVQICKDSDDIEFIPESSSGIQQAWLSIKAGDPGVIMWSTPLVLAAPLQGYCIRLMVAAESLSEFSISGELIDCSYNNAKSLPCSFSLSASVQNENGSRLIDWQTGRMSFQKTGEISSDKLYIPIRYKSWIFGFTKSSYDPHTIPRIILNFNE